MRNEHGYTLAELMVAMAVMALLLAGIFLTLREGQSAYQYGAGRAEVQQNGRVALDRMLRELRTASTITTATATDLKFTYLDETGTLITVEYTLSGTPSAGSPVLLQRNQTGAANQPDIVIGGVSNLTMTYYDINNVVTATAANVRSVDVQLTTVPENTALASPNIRTALVEGRVRVRNE
jgi:prepilin-type N-terminal cleavage/methylation domain-containing protein